MNNVSLNYDIQKPTFTGCFRKKSQSFWRGGKKYIKLIWCLLVLLKSVCRWFEFDVFSCLLVSILCSFLVRPWWQWCSRSYVSKQNNTKRCKRYRAYVNGFFILLSVHLTRLYFVYVCGGGGRGVIFFLFRNPLYSKTHLRYNFKMLCTCIQIDF